MLFSASLPIPDTWRVAGTQVGVTHQLKDLSSLGFQKHFLLEPEITSPPSPPADFLLDWEAMGVVQRDGYFPDSPFDQHEEMESKKMPLQNNMLFDKNTPFMDSFTNSGNQFVDKRRLSENTSPVTNNVPHKSTTVNNTQTSPTDPTIPERMKRVEHKIEEELSRQLSLEKRTNLDDRPTTGRDDKATEPAHNMIILSSNKRSECSRRDPILEEESSMNKTSSKVENMPSSRKPLIPRVLQSESFSSLTDIMKRIQPQQSTSGLLKRGSKAAVSEMSRSTMDLSVHNTDTNHDDKGVPVPRFKASCFDPGHMTPAFALMKKRNNEVKSVLYRTPKTFLPRERPRSSSYALNMDWRRSLAEKEGEQE